MTDETLIDSVLAQTRLFASWVRDADPALPVPSCPDWKLADLVEHVGAAYVPGFADAMRGEGQTIAWVADDIDRAWHLRRGDAPLTLTRGGAAAVDNTDVVVQGPAVDLLHVVSRRRPLDEDTTCRVSGDRAELVHLISNMKWVGA